MAEGVRLLSGYTVERPCRGFESLPLRQFFGWAVSSVGERLSHTQEVAGSNPAPPTIIFVRSRRSSVAEQLIRNQQVGGSNPLAGSNCFIIIPNRVGG